MMKLVRSRCLKQLRPVSLGLLICLAAAVAAYAFSVTETTDYPGGINFSTDPSAGTLDNGANTVSGSLSGNCITATFGIDCNPGTIAGGDSDDTFLVTVPAGYQITSFTVTSSSATGPASFRTSVEVDKQNPTPPPNFNTQIGPTDIVLNGTTTNLVSTPLGAGVYAISVFGQTASATGAFSLSWTVTANLAPVVVSPTVAINNLINLINDPLSGLVLTQGQVSSFTDKLNNVLTSVQAGQNKQAINQLNAFISSVETALKTGKISAQDANTLIVAANAITASLQ